MIISLGTKRLMKTQIFEKKAIFPVKRIFWPIFLVLSKMTNVREELRMVDKVI